MITFLICRLSICTKSNKPTEPPHSSRRKKDYMHYTHTHTHAHTYTHTHTHKHTHTHTLTHTETRIHTKKHRNTQSLKILSEGKIGWRDVLEKKRRSRNFLFSHSCETNKHNTLRFIGLILGQALPKAFNFRRSSRALAKMAVCSRVKKSLLCPISSEAGEEDGRH